MRNLQSRNSRQERLCSHDTDEAHEGTQGVNMDWSIIITVLIMLWVLAWGAE